MWLKYINRYKLILVKYLVPKGKIKRSAIERWQTPEGWSVSFLSKMFPSPTPSPSSSSSPTSRESPSETPSSSLSKRPSSSSTERSAPSPSESSSWFESWDWFVNPHGGGGSGDDDWIPFFSFYLLAVSCVSFGPPPPDVKINLIFLGIEGDNFQELYSSRKFTAQINHVPWPWLKSISKFDRGPLPMNFLCVLIEALFGLIWSSLQTMEKLPS